MNHRNSTLALCGLLCLGLATAVAANDLVIHAGTLIDGLAQESRQHVSILIHEGRIAGVEPGFVAPAGATVIDLSTATVMPGFIDCHVHVSAKLPSRTNAIEDWLTHSDLDRAFDGAVFAAAMLQQGFTSARDVGGGDETVALRNAIDAGKVPGPRLWVSLEPLGPTGGHADPRAGLDRLLAHRNWDNGLVNSTDEARLRVREHKRRGADLIKMLPSGGIASTGDDPHRQLMTNEEMATVVQTAHALGMKVAAHIYPAEAIENAVRAGVDSVEHGSFATAQTFALMKEHGTYLVPTLTVYELFYDVAVHHPELLAPGTPQKEIANDLLPRRNLPLAIRSGVKIAYGSDIGEGDHSMEFSLLIANGMSPQDALNAATRNAADLIGASDRIGAIAPGRYADLVATAADPRQDPAQFRKVEFVMKGGVVYREHGAPVAGWPSAPR
ncbi:MAG: amidohydrolase family protein [Gammaproteobacteria bacterium]|nr:amidohydrolase family protein [Gammaproteobacteria bacterium]